MAASRRSRCHPGIRPRAACDTRPPAGDVLSDRAAVRARPRPRQGKGSVNGSHCPPARPRLSDGRRERATAGPRRRAGRSGRLPIENLSPTVAVGAQASYIVHLFGGLGSYGLTLRYGDGWQDARSVSGPSSRFDYSFATPGTYLQTATVSGAGSTATCSSSTTVY